MFRGGAATVEGLRHLPPQQEIANELRAEANVLGAPVTSVYLGQDATVTKVKSLDLADTRFVAFATHGLVAGDLPALAEPALALPPPSVPTEEDEDILRASNVSQLKLNADWWCSAPSRRRRMELPARSDRTMGRAEAFPPRDANDDRRRRGPSSYWALFVVAAKAEAADKQDQSRLGISSVRYLRIAARSAK